MKNHRWRAGSLLAAGIVAGGIGAASLGAHAADTANDSDPPAHVRVHFEGGPRSADLAKELGVSEAKLQAAFEAVHDDLRPPKPPTGPPSEAEMKAMESKFAAALAKELGLSQEKVEAALAKERAEAEADHRSELSKRLSAAVDDGKLTSDDKASVLKAFDAGVLDGPHLVMRRG